MFANFQVRAGVLNYSENPPPVGATEREQSRTKFTTPPVEENVTHMHAQALFGNGTSCVCIRIGLKFEIVAGPLHQRDMDIAYSYNLCLASSIKLET